MSMLNGLDRLISRKTVTFSFSEPYDFALSFLGNLHTAISENPSLQSNELWQRSKWCSFLTHLRTLFDQNLHVL